MMILIVVLAAFALLSLAFWTVLRNSSTVLAVADSKSVTEPLVDIAAFRNLVDPAEEEFLRNNLTPQLFRTIQRERMLAAVEYVQCAAGQARMLVQLVESTRDEQTGELPHISEELVTAAIRLRALSILVLFALYLRVAFPGVRISFVQVPAMYENVMGLGKLANLKRPVSRALTAAG
ncbi:MAG: hypothetical protein JWO91_869 [Acidobacteriaceae bacterium]|jgi:hypothetical protein|nr:hypothetical protein [Acidobacteriaceae bacterium]